MKLRISERNLYPASTDLSMNTMMVLVVKCSIYGLKYGNR